MRYSRHKSGRMLLLLHLREEGILDGLTLEEIGQVCEVNRSTILRDLRELDVVEAEYRHLMAVQPWIKRELTVAEFAERINAQDETVRCLIRDGLVRAHKRPNRRWYIPVSELERWTNKRQPA